VVTYWTMLQYQDIHPYMPHLSTGTISLLSISSSIKNCKNCSILFLLTGRGIKQIILEWILKKQGGKAQAEFIWFRLGPTVRLLWRQYYTFSSTNCREFDNLKTSSFLRILLHCNGRLIMKNYAPKMQFIITVPYSTLQKP